MCDVHLRNMIFTNFSEVILDSSLAVCIVCVTSALFAVVSSQSSVFSLSLQHAFSLPLNYITDMC